MVQSTMTKESEWRKLARAMKGKKVQNVVKYAQQMETSDHNRMSVNSITFTYMDKWNPTVKWNLVGT
jgi:hypothetical protein